MDEILESPTVYAPLTKLQCSPTSDGAAAAVIMSQRLVDAIGGRDRAVRVSGQSLTTDRSGALDPSAGPIRVVGVEMSRAAAMNAYDEAGVTAADIDVCELHDCFSTNELLSYEALGFAQPGQGHLLVEAEATTYGGSGPVVNPSGGLISKGHPLGATGLAQCAELTWQLRGEAEARQVANATWALQHNIGLGGAAVVTIYRGPAD
jgi:acetyl-CoA acetyltransferase